LPYLSTNIIKTEFFSQSGKSFSLNCITHFAGQIAKPAKVEGTSTSASASKSVSAPSTSERENKRETTQSTASNRSLDVKDELQSITNANNNSSSNGSQTEHRSRELERERDRERDREREREREERHSLSSTRSSQRDSSRNNNNKERTEAEVQQRARERTQRLEEIEAATLRAQKREKATRRDERSQHRHDGVETVDLVAGNTNSSQDHRHYEEYEGRQRDRDLSSVSNESNGSLQHRRSHETIDYEKGVYFSILCTQLLTNLFYRF